MVEEPLKMKKKDQINFDEQEAVRLQAKFDEEVRLAREKDKANVALIEEWNVIQANIDNMAGWKPKDLKSKSFANIQELFNKAFKRVNTFVDFRTGFVEGTKMEERDELEQENAKKQKVDDDQEAAKKKELMKIVPNEEEVAVNVIPLATKPLSIMLRSFDMEDLETLWKLVKAKHGYTRLEEGYKRVLWGDLKTMFEHHVEDAVWRNLRENKVLVWKLFDSCRVHFVRFQNLHVFMLVEKRYPLKPAIITDMLNKKLQDDHWN
ncbi:hypothetical protein Tco_1143810 [Tanacetum coccineum]